MEIVVSPLEFHRNFYVNRIINCNLGRYLVRKLAKKLRLRDIRRRLGLNQQEFWSKVGVTQSGGSRYETGRAMPEPVRELLRLVHIEGIDPARIKGEHVSVANHLRAAYPSLYQRLKQEVRNLSRKSSRQ